MHLGKRICQQSWATRAHDQIAESLARIRKSKNRKLLANGLCHVVRRKMSVVLLGYSCIGMTSCRAIAAIGIPAMAR